MALLYKKVEKSAAGEEETKVSLFYEESGVPSFISEDGALSLSDCHS